MADDLVAGIKCLRAFLQFLEISPTLVDSGALRPLRRVAYALRDVAEGSKPPMLFSRPPRGDGAPAGTSDDILRGQTAVALEVLIRAGEKPGPASQFLAKEMHTHKIRMRGGKTVEAKQIERWRHEVGTTVSPMIPMLFNGMLSELERDGLIPEKGAKPTERQVAEARKSAIAMLESLWRSGF